MGCNRLTKRERPSLFPNPADRWLESKTALTRLGRAYHSQYISKLKKRFRSRLVSDISADDIASVQHERQAEGLSGRQITVKSLRSVRL
jgi:hypothetical protein